MADSAAFHDPGPEFRSIPLWSWNGALDPQRLDRQWQVFRRMGFGGAMPHARTGLADDYLGERFITAVRRAAQRATEEYRHLWLYDEDRWPSGGAGGRVTRDVQWRERWLSLSWQSLTEGRGATYRHPQGAGDGDVRLIARWRVRLDAQGRLITSRLLHADELDADPQGPQDSRLVYGYREINQGWSFFNGGCPVDALNPQAIQRFISETHERYLQAFDGTFPACVQAMFTDEPQMPHQRPLSDPQTLDGRIAWTDDLPHSYRDAWGQDLLQIIPELFWERADGLPSVARWRFHEHRSARFASTCVGALGSWCDQHGIALTGHLMEESSLSSQAMAIGDAMRCYGAFAMPGIDMLCDKVELLTAKQCQSAKHQYGRQRMMSECYGVMGWRAGFAAFKAHVDWQMALGVTVRAPHLAWLGMAGEAKRDYPPSFGEQSPWWREFAVLEQHQARISQQLSCGVPGVRVALLHGVDSAWLLLGPRSQTAAALDDLDRSCADHLAWLIHGLIDVDMLCESTLPELCPVAGNPLRVGAMAYDAVVVPPLLTLRGSTLERLTAFAEAGGLVVFSGAVPTMVDAVPDPRPGLLAKRCRQVSASRHAVLSALAAVRELSVSTADGAPAEHLVSHLRIDGENRQLFVCSLDRQRGLAGGTLRVRGRWQAQQWDTIAGTRIPHPSKPDIDGWTALPVDLPPAGHLMLSLSPAIDAVVPSSPAPRWLAAGELPDPESHSSDEPAAIPLDRAIWKIDDEPWQPQDDVLAIDAAVRQRLRMPPRDGGVMQPYADDAPAPVLGAVTVAYRLHLQAPLSVQIAVEDPAGISALRLNGQSLPIDDVGWWMDQDLRCVRLPPLSAGDHQVEIVRGYHRRAGLEPAYLLGDFSATIIGRRITLGVPPIALTWGDWTRQGLSCATGARTVRCRVTLAEGRWRIAVPQLAAAAVTVAIDGRRCGVIGWAPWRVELGEVTAGEHVVELIVLPTRQNIVGNLHDYDDADRWYGPHVWRRQGDCAGAEYRLDPLGILTAPLLERVESGS